MVSANFENTSRIRAFGSVRIFGHDEVRRTAERAALGLEAFRVPYLWRTRAVFQGGRIPCGGTAVWGPFRSHNPRSRVAREVGSAPRDECVALGLFWRDSKQAGAQS